MAHAVGIIQVKKLRSIRQTCRKKEKNFPLKIFSSGRELTAPPFLFLPDVKERQAAHKRRWSCAHSVESIDRLLGAASKLVGHFIKIWKNPTPTKTLQLEKRNAGRRRLVNGRRNHEDQKKETADALCIPSLHKSSAHFSFILLFSARINLITRKKEENWTTLVYTRRHIIIIVICADQALLLMTIVLLLPSCYCATHKDPQVHFVVLRPNNRLAKESDDTDRRHATSPRHSVSLLFSHSPFFPFF